MARLALTVTAILLLAPAAAPPATDATAALEATAKKLRQLGFFRSMTILEDENDFRRLPEKQGEEHAAAILPLRNRWYSEASLIPLLSHRDPLVRALAVAGLFAHDNPHSLRHLEPLLDDGAKILPHPDGGFSYYLPNRMPQLREQTVGGVARSCVRIYLRAAGYGGTAAGDEKARLKEYWQEREARAYCASWFAVRLGRASQHTSPTPKGRLENVRAVRQQTDRLPKADRGLTLLWLFDYSGADALVSEKELVEALKEVGPDRLLDLFRIKRVSTDPDLKPEGWTRYVTTWFVLRHAEELFRPKDADALLECGKLPDFYVAAAKLQPKRAESILAAGWEEFEGGHRYRDGDERMMLSAAQWRLVEGARPEMIAGRFHDEQPRMNTFPHCRAQLLRTLGETARSGDRRLLAAIARDRRFDRLDWQSLVEMALLVNQVSKKTVIDPDELTGAEDGRKMDRWRATLRKHLLPE